MKLVFFRLNEKRVTLFVFRKKGTNKYCKTTVQAFIYISKAFVKVWDDGIILKLTQNDISANLLNILLGFWHEKKQRVVLNGQFSTWQNVNAEVPQGSYLDLYCFLFTSMIRQNAFHLMIWTHLLKKTLMENLIFCAVPLLFNNANVTWTSSQKQLRIILEFDDHLNMVSGKMNKTIGLFCKLQLFLSRAAPILIYKTFIRPHLDYGDIVYDQAYDMSFHQKMESIQYNNCVAITGDMRSILKEKLYKELGLESLQWRHWYRELGMFYKICAKLYIILLSWYLKKRLHICWQYPSF